MCFIVTFCKSVVKCIDPQLSIRLLQLENNSEFFTNFHFDIESREYEIYVKGFLESIAIWLPLPWCKSTKTRIEKPTLLGVH